MVGAGITVHECMAAHDILGAEGITARVLDCYCEKPIDAHTLRMAASRDRVPDAILLMVFFVATVSLFAFAGCACSPSGAMRRWRMTPKTTATRTTAAIAADIRSSG